MTKNISKTQEQRLAKVINQMDGWMQHETRLTLSISTPLFYLLLRGRVVGRQQGLFLFDSYGEGCRVPLLPENYDRVLCSQKGPAWATLEKSGMPGSLEISEDDREAGFGEMCADWVLSNMVANTDCSNVADQKAR